MCWRTVTCGCSCASRARPRRARGGPRRKLYPGRIERHGAVERARQHDRELRPRVPRDRARRHSVRGGRWRCERRRRAHARARTQRGAVLAVQDGAARGRSAVACCCFRRLARAARLFRASGWFARASRCCASGCCSSAQAPCAELLPRARLPSLCSFAPLPSCLRGATADPQRPDSAPGSPGRRTCARARSRSCPRAHVQSLSHDVCLLSLPPKNCCGVVESCTCRVMPPRSSAAALTRRRRRAGADEDGRNHARTGVPLQSRAEQGASRRSLVSVSSRTLDDGRWALMTKGRSLWSWRVVK